MPWASRRSHRAKVRSRLVEAVDKDMLGLASKELLLIHGSEDRRVLLENSLLFSQKLVEQNIIFQQQVG